MKFVLGATPIERRHCVQRSRLQVSRGDFVGGNKSVVLDVALVSRRYHVGLVFCARLEILWKRTVWVDSIARS